MPSGWNAFRRLRNRSRRFLSDHLGRRNFLKQDESLHVSFTFDDFPESALVNGGAVLQEHGAAGTYYVSMGRLGLDSPSGTLADADALGTLLSAGHELGCHTYDHLDGWSSTEAQMCESILRNQEAAGALAPGTRLQTFAYPINEPRIRLKRVIGQRFLCCRGGGQTHNGRFMDMNLIRSCFLDSRNTDDPGSIKRLIDDSRAEGGWLVFATHDVQQHPSRFGCTIGFLRSIVSYCVRSGVRILPVARCCIEMGMPQPPAGSGKSDA
jgi:peptidoglycan/xylan/chitin deacetylase (PgdA/CDA1 family)